MLVDENDKSGEKGVEDDRGDDISVDRSFDKAQCERPSSRLLATAMIPRKRLDAMGRHFAYGVEIRYL